MGLSSYTINYGGLEETEKHDKAIADVRNWFGDEKFERITNDFRGQRGKKYAAGQMPWSQFVHWSDFAGVRGYPARAWFDHCFPDRKGEYLIEESEEETSVE